MACEHRCAPKVKKKKKKKKKKNATTGSKNKQTINISKPRAQGIRPCHAPPPTPKNRAHMHSNSKQRTTPALEANGGQRDGQPPTFGIPAKSARPNEPHTKFLKERGRKIDREHDRSSNKTPAHKRPLSEPTRREKAILGDIAHGESAILGGCASAN
jgi:hypothetical protein